MEIDLINYLNNMDIFTKININPFINPPTHEVLILYNLFIKNEFNKDDIIKYNLFNYLGIYYFIWKNYKEMKKNLLSIYDELSYYYLGKYYQKKSKYDKMFFYYNMITSPEFITLKYKALSHYYYDNEKYIDIIKYALLSNNYILLGKYYYIIKDNIKAYNYFEEAAKNNINGQIALADYYVKTNESFQVIQKLYNDAISKNNIRALYKLGRYYKSIGDVKTMKTYYLYAINKGSTKAMNLLGRYYHYDKKKYNKMYIYYDMAINLKNYNSYIDLLYFNLRQNKNPLKYFDLINKLKPQFIKKIYKIQANNYIGYYYSSININMAINYYNMSIKMNDLVAINYKADLFKKQGYYKMANKYYKLVIDKYKNKLPTDDIIREYNYALLNFKNKLIIY